MPNVTRAYARTSNLVALVAVIVVTVAAVRGRVLAADPLGEWFLTGDTPGSYAAAPDPAVPVAGRPSLRIHAVTPTRGFGTLVRAVPAADYRGRRVRLAGEVRVSDATLASLWLRAGGTCGRADVREGTARGAADWQHAEVVLDVAPDADALDLGLRLEGGGMAWAGGLRLEVVPSTVPVTAAALRMPSECPTMAPKGLEYRTWRPLDAAP
jgi:hypothetical protein